MIHMEYSLIDVIQTYLLDKMMVVVIALWILGTFLKKTPAVPDWIIIWILLGIGVSLSFLMLGFTPDSFVQGVLATGFAVFVHQIIKQTVKRK